MVGTPVAVAQTRCRGLILRALLLAADGHWNQIHQKHVYSRGFRPERRKILNYSDYLRWWPCTDTTAATPSGPYGWPRSSEPYAVGKPLFFHP